MRAQFGKRNSPARQFLKKGGNGAMQFAHLQCVIPVLRASHTDAFQLFERGQIDVPGVAIHREFDHVFRAD